MSCRFIPLIVHLKYYGSNREGQLRETGLRFMGVAVDAVIQARMNSTRLPGKVLMDIEGEPMLARVIQRTERAKLLGRVVVATTTKPSDDILLQFCRSKGWQCFRGSESDVLDRYFHVADTLKSDIVVRISSDSPLIDPDLIDQVVRVCLEGQPLLDYVSNSLQPRTFPLGLDVEAVRFSALKTAWQQDENIKWREHVTPYIYRHPEKFNIRAVDNRLDYSSLRWTVDTPEDLELIRQIYAYFAHDRFGWQEVLTAVEDHKEWLDINRHVRQKSVAI
jgi:spore coat polysaccharide biosynthesis protein SpsF